MKWYVVDRLTKMFAVGRAGYETLGRLEHAVDEGCFATREEADALAAAYNAKFRAEPSFAAVGENEIELAVGKPVWETEFPETLDPKMLQDFIPTVEGWTRPKVGVIGKSKFVFKHGTKTSDAHVENEYAACEFLRAAGLKVPAAKLYDFLGRKVLLLAYVEGAQSVEWAIRGGTVPKRLRDELARTYGMVHLMAGFDTYNNGNVLWDGEDLWFVDNGSAFQWRATGGLKRDGHFFGRSDPSDAQSGVMGLWNFQTTNVLHRALPDLTLDEAVAGLRTVDLAAAAALVPPASRTDGVLAYFAAVKKRVSHGASDKAPGAAAAVRDEPLHGAGPSARDRAKGMLWGLVVGDALGSPIQFSGKDSHPRITEMVPCPVFDLPAGYWTDDGSMAMCVMDSYVRKGGYDLADVGATFCRWLRDGYLSSVPGRSFDVGFATSSSVAAIARGSLVNGSEDSQGNGSIMRFAPSWLVARALKRPGIVHEVSDLTHASSAVRRTCDEFAAVLDDHFAGRRTRRGPDASTPRADVTNSGWCVASLKAALWAFNTTVTFEDALVAAVNLGGDSDSIGAVCGQIAGAWYGFGAIPDRWVKAVKDWEKVDALVESFLDALERDGERKSAK